MDALWGRMESDQSDLDVIMVGQWTLCGVGWSLISLIWTSSWPAHGCSDMLCGVGWSLICLIWTYHGPSMVALRDGMESAQSDLDVIMVGPWMLCGVGWSRIRLSWMSSWPAHGCSVVSDGV